MNQVLTPEDIEDIKVLLENETANGFIILHKDINDHAWKIHSEQTEVNAVLHLFDLISESNNILLVLFNISSTLKKGDILKFAIIDPVDYKQDYSTLSSKTDQEQQNAYQLYKQKHLPPPDTISNTGSPINDEDPIGG